MLDEQMLRAAPCGCNSSLNNLECWPCIALRVIAGKDKEIERLRSVLTETVPRTEEDERLEHERDEARSLVRLMVPWWPGREILALPDWAKSAR